MPQNITFEQWKEQVLAAIQSYQHLLEVDEDLLYMAYDMEGISVEEAIAEYTASAKRILENRS